MATLGVARLNAGRLGAFRLGWVWGGTVRIYINNVLRQADIRVQGIGITDELNHEPDNATFRVNDFVPVAGQTVQILLGGLRADDQVFSGHLLSVKQGYQGKPAIVVYDCTCIDVAWLLTRRPVLRKYTAQSATAIIIDLIARFGAQFTVANVTAGLATIDEITFTNEDLATAITRVMDRIGGFWYADFNRDIHAFVTDPVPAEAITQAAPRTMLNIESNIDLSQVATRVTVRGGGTNAAADVDVGATTLPVKDDTHWYSASGGIVECGAQRIAYTGLGTMEGLGSLVGGSLQAAAPGAPFATVNATAPAGVGTPPSTFTCITDSPTVPSGLDPSATYKYVLTYVTAEGETLPSAQVTGTTNVKCQITVTGLPVPTDYLIISKRLYRTDGGGATFKLLTTLAVATTVLTDTIPDGSLSATVPPVVDTSGGSATGRVSGTYTYKVTNVIGGGETLASPASDAVTAGSVTPDALAMIVVASTGTATIPPGTIVRFRVSFVNASGEGPAGRSTVPFTVTAAGLVAIGSTPTPAIGIPLGPGGTTSRRIYRSDNGGAYGEVLRIMDNTTTGATGVNGTIGAPPPPSGSQIDVAIGLGPTGTTARRIYRALAGGTAYKLVANVADNTTILRTDNVSDNSLGDELKEYSTAASRPGETQLAVYDLAQFPASGWVLVGSQYLRYTGAVASTGVGPSPGLLTGIPASGGGAILTPIPAEAEIENAPYLTGCTGILYAIKAGEAVGLIVTVNDVAAQTAMAAYVGIGDGVHEMNLEDGRWSLIEATAQGQAELARRKDPFVKVSFDSRDPTLKSGKSVSINTTTPAIVGTFKIQRVTYSHIGMGTKTTYPLKHVELATVRYSFEALLKQVARRKVAF